MPVISEKEESKHLEGLSREGSSVKEEEEPVEGAQPADFESTGKADAVGGDDGPVEEPTVDEENKAEEPAAEEEDKTEEPAVPEEAEP